MRNFVIVLLILTFNGCSNMKLSDYKDKKPLLKLEEYFEGKTIARGVFESNTFDKLPFSDNLEIKYIG